MFFDIDGAPFVHTLAGRYQLSASTAGCRMIAAPGRLARAAPSNAAGASRTELDRQVAV
jgi:hypothetical protein